MEFVIISVLMSSYTISIGCVLLKRIKGEPLLARHSRGCEHDELGLDNVRL